MARAAQPMIRAAQLVGNPRDRAIGRLGENAMSGRWIRCTALNAHSRVGSCSRVYPDLAADGVANDRVRPAKKKPPKPRASGGQRSRPAAGKRMEIAIASPGRDRRKGVRGRSFRPACSRECRAGSCRGCQPMSNRDSRASHSRSHERRMTHPRCHSRRVNLRIGLKSQVLQEFERSGELPPPTEFERLG